LVSTSFGPAAVAAASNDGCILVRELIAHSSEGQANTTSARVDARARAFALSPPAQFFTHVFSVPAMLSGDRQGNTVVLLLVDNALVTFVAAADVVSPPV
jgi:hypothetical protein